MTSPGRIGLMFAHRRDLNIHERMHAGEKPFQCSKCERSFSSLSTFDCQTNIRRGEHKNTECGKCCQSRTALAVHRQSHSGEKLFICTVCGKRFAWGSNLVNHSRMHSGEKPYKCHVCDKAFSQSGNLNTHVRVHTGEKPYKCSLCDKSFNQSSSLQTHKRRVHSNSRPRKCP